MNGLLIIGTQPHLGSVPVSQLAAFNSWGRLTYVTIYFYSEHFWGLGREMGILGEITLRIKWTPLGRSQSACTVLSGQPLPSGSSGCPRNLFPTVINWVRGCILFPGWLSRWWEVQYPAITLLTLCICRERCGTETRDSTLATRIGSKLIEIRGG